MDHSNHTNSAHQDHQMMGHDLIKPKRKLSDFTPLIIIFLIILIYTGVRWYLSPQPDSTFVMSNFMAAFFIIFGGFKVINWKGFANAYRIYDLIAKRSVVYAYLYPLIELALGLAYLFQYQLGIINWITLIVMLISAAGVYNELRQKKQIACACLGVVFKIPMTNVTLIEDLLMAIMAVAMILV